MATAISVASFKSLPFDPVKDFEMISRAGQFDLLFVGRRQFQIQDSWAISFQDGKANPGKLNIGSIVVGSTQDLGAELFKSSADLNVQIVTFKNSPDVVVSLLRNDVQLVVDFPPACGQVAGKKLRVLATSGPQARLLPDVPTADRPASKAMW